jgi:hypothetical protein
MPFQYLAIPLRGKLVEQRPKILAYLPVQFLPPALRDENKVIFAIPF